MQKEADNGEIVGAIILISLQNKNLQRAAAYRLLGGETLYSVLADVCDEDSGQIAIAFADDEDGKSDNGTDHVS